MASHQPITQTVVDILYKKSLYSFSEMSFVRKKNDISSRNRVTDLVKRQKVFQIIVSVQSKPVIYYGIFLGVVFD